MSSTTSSRRWRILIATVLGVAALWTSALVAPAASATGDHHGHWHAPTRYLALGDSVPFGFQPTAVNPDYGNAENFVGYPEVLASHRRLRLANASCPGETTASMIDVTAQSNGCSNSLDPPFVGYRTVFPLHVAYSGSQLDYAVSYLRWYRRTRLVSLTIGANDMFVCQRTTFDQCTGADFAVMTAQVEKNVGFILSTLRHRAHYWNQIAIVSYYSTNYHDPVVTGAVGALNAALARAAEANGAVVADGFGAVGQAAAVEDGDTCAAGLLIALPKGGCDVHPTLAGHQVLAGALGEVAAHRRVGAPRH